MCCECGVRVQVCVSVCVLCVCFEYVSIRECVSECIVCICECI